jgi:hypothetical protein
MQSATLLQKVAGRPRGWAEMVGLSDGLWERQGELSTGARSYGFNSHVVVDGTAIWWACVVCRCQACQSGAFHHSDLCARETLRFQWQAGTRAGT